MGTHTVYGCYRRADGVIEFDETTVSCSDATITGCYIATGAHAGKIEITHDYPRCPKEVYYACYVPTTGKFETEISDNCCYTQGWEAGTCCGPSDCDEVPDQIKVTFANLSDCPAIPGLPCDVGGCSTCSCESVFNGRTIIFDWVIDAGSDCESTYKEQIGVNCDIIRADSSCDSDVELQVKIILYDAGCGADERRWRVEAGWNMTGHAHSCFVNWGTCVYDSDCNWCKFPYVLPNENAGCASYQDCSDFTYSPSDCCAYRADSGTATFAVV